MGSRTMMGISLLAGVGLIAALVVLRRSGTTETAADRITVYCAAGLKAPVEAAIAAYEQHRRDQGRPVTIEIQYGGSGTLLSLLRVSGSGDLFVAGDDSFIALGRDYGVVREAIPLAVMTPVIAVAKDSGLSVQSLSDLVAQDGRFGMGMPDGTAIGAATRRALDTLGLREAFEQKVVVMKPTVNDLASDVKIGALDAAIVFDVTARQHGLPIVRDPALDQQTAQVMVGVLESTRQAPAALHLARFLGAPEKGLPHFEAHHFAVTEGDAWAEAPEITLFSGGINKNAMDALIAGFEQREGVRVNTVFQGCGGLTAQMRAMGGPESERGFPDGYLACDVYYLEPVADWFDHKAAVSSTRIVIVTAQGNPKGIRSLADLGNPGVRIVLGHPTHCTIGALSDRLLKAAGLYDRIIPNVVERQPSSGMMVPPVLSGAADASLAYFTDTRAERERLTVVEIDEAYAAYARAAQPYGVAVNSPHRHLMQRFYEHIGRGRDAYETLGFTWEYGRDPGEFNVVAPAGARPHRTEGARP